jgi:hypothetical protein
MGQEPRDWTYGESGEIHGVSFRDQGETMTLVQSEKMDGALCRLRSEGWVRRGASQGKTQRLEFFDAIGPSKTPL